jgi:anti-sigma factor RsiW
VTNEELMRYLDGELPSEARAQVESEVARSTELQRELAIYRAIREDVRDLTFALRTDGSVWDAVDRRLTRPVGWILFVAGTVLWLAHGAWVFATSSADAWEKLSVSALAIGFLILFGSAIFERLREWRSDPYRDIQR